MNRFIIEIPNAEAGQIEALAREAGALEGVQGSGVSQTRGLDPASITVWIQLASMVTTAVGAAIPVIQKILDLIRNQGHKNARIKFADGTEISVEASPADVEKLVGTMRAGGG